MNNKEYLDSIDWIFYLKREQRLFLFASFIKPYGEDLEKETGFGFKHQLQYFKGKSGIFFKSEKEMKESNEHFAKLIEENDPRIDMWIKKEEELHEKSYNFEDFENPKELIDYFKEILLYDTVIPYRLFVALPFVKSDISKIKEKLEKTRFRSLYPDLMENFIGPLFDKVADKLGVDKGLASMVTPDELIDILEGKVILTEDELERRKQGCYFYQKDGSVVFYYGEIPSLEFEKDLNVSSFKGEIACKGKVVGKVKIVNNPEDMDKFNQGDILVSINTNPSIMEIIKKAGAIVTDEGGALCHAAVISREFGIPCIIGTKYATEILKDNDEVEVDANEGIVRKVG